MTPLSLEFHPRAVVDARAARRWYARRSAGVAARFLAELDRVVAQITSAPQQGAPYLHGTRVNRLRRFPYLVVYLEQSTSLLVLAVAHGKRKPGYWQRRLP